MGITQSSTDITALSISRAVSITCKAVGKECAEDCSTLLTCLKIGDDAIYSHTCAAPTPYCVTSGCTATPDDTVAACKTKTATNICTGEGIFPDPTDCHNFVVCASATGTATAATPCPTGYNYNSKTRSCRLGNNCSQWTECSKASNDKKMVSYNPDKAYYAYCAIGSAPIMFRCADEQSEIYDVQQDVCRYNCQREGTFVDRSNCKGYIMCRRVNNLWWAQTSDCPTGYVFKDTQCVRATTCTNLNDA